VLRIAIPEAMQVARALGVQAEIALELLSAMAAGLNDAQKEEHDGES